MDVHNLDFVRISGPKDSKQANFELLVGQLLATHFGAKTVDGSGGDNGVDAYLGKFEGRAVVFQAKYFLDRLEAPLPAGRSQVYWSTSRNRV